MDIKTGCPNLNDGIHFSRCRPDAIIPVNSIDNPAIFDLYSNNRVVITGGAGCREVATGIRVTLPRGYCGRVVMRNDLALREHLCVSGGLAENGREIAVAVFCCKAHTDPGAGVRAYTIKAGEKFAMLVIEKTYGLVDHA